MQGKRNTGNLIENMEKIENTLKEQKKKQKKEFIDVDAYNKKIREKFLLKMKKKKNATVTDPKKNEEKKPEELISKKPEDKPKIDKIGSNSPEKKPDTVMQETRRKSTIVSDPNNPKNPNRLLKTEINIKRELKSSKQEDQHRKKGPDIDNDLVYNELNPE